MSDGVGSLMTQGAGLILKVNLKLIVSRLLYLKAPFSITDRLCADDRSCGPSLTAKALRRIPPVPAAAMAREAGIIIIDQQLTLEERLAIGRRLNRLQAITHALFQNDIFSIIEAQDLFIT